jgi:hypothetical protein
VISASRVVQVWELTRHTAQKLVDLYEKGDVTELDTRIRKIINEAIGAGLDRDHVEEQVQSWNIQLGQRKPSWNSVDLALADLRRLLLGEQTYRGKFRHTLQRVAGWMFDHYVAVASLITILASGFYGLAYERFYQALDITPEQAGLSVTQILIHSAIGGLALVALTSLVVFVCLMPAVPVRDDIDSKKQKGDVAKLGANIGLTLLALLFLADLNRYLGASWALLGFFAFISALVLLVTNIRIRLRWILVPIPSLRPMAFKQDRYLALLVVIAIPIGLLVTAAITVHEANRLGEKAGNGEAVRDPELIGMPFLGVRAEPALVSWDASKPVGSGSPRCMFYLGASNGSVILYDHRSTGTFQVPASTVTIELRRNMSSCEAPVNRRVPSVWRRGTDLLGCGPGTWDFGGVSHEFSFEWTMEGKRITEQFDRISPSLEDRYLSEGSVIHCRVTARTPLGSDVAVSRGIVVRHNVVLRRGDSISASG